MMPNLFLNFGYILFLWDFDFGFLLRCWHIVFTQFIFFIMFVHFVKVCFLFLLLDFCLWVFVFGCLLFFGACFFAFLGYILPCTMMSFWGLTVFSNVFAVIPVLGLYLLVWIWCGEYINDFTLLKLHCLHLVTPICCFFFVVLPFFLFAFLYEFWWFCWPFCFLLWTGFFFEFDVFTWFFVFFWCFCCFWVFFVGCIDILFYMRNHFCGWIVWKQPIRFCPNGFFCFFLGF